MFLLFLCLGTASVKAQVRIGGNAAPNAGAVLDLNSDNSATPAGNKGALALPRVSLASDTAKLNGAIPITGMLVYNTNSIDDLSSGLCMWNGSSWLNVSTTGNSLVYFDTLQLMASPKTVTWQMVLDTNFYVSAQGLAANSWHRIRCNGILVSDVCFAKWPMVPTVVQAYPDFLIYYALGNTKVTGPRTGAGVRCFRATI